MDFTCQKCLRDTDPVEDGSSVITLELSRYGLDVLKKLLCPDCKVCVALQTTPSQLWMSLSQSLRSHQQLDGWQPLRSCGDHLVLYIMSQIIYNETADISEPLFDMPDPADVVKILWRHGCAVAFYTVKPKGTAVLSTLETYDVHTLDTAFVLPSCRKTGLGLSILQDLVATRPGQDLAISTPISKSMAHVIKKFLLAEPAYRMKLWEVEGAGSHGSRKLLYYTLRNRLR